MSNEALNGNFAKPMLAPVFNYRCKKCKSTYTELKEQLDYSNCVARQPGKMDKCNGQLVPF
jgi:hypothetical protein